MNQDEFLKQLREAFAIESKEHLQTIAAGLLTLEDSAGEFDPELLETTYRAAHSLKGAARAVDLKDIEYTCHSMESAFQAMKRGSLKPGPRIFEALHRAFHLVQSQLDGEAVTAVELGEVSRTLEKLAAGEEKEKALETSPAQTQPEPPKAIVSIREQKPMIPPTLRVRAERLDAILLKAENLIAAKQVLASLKLQLKTLCDSVETAQSAEQARQHALRISREISNKLASGTIYISQMVDSLIEDAQSLLMLPASTLFDTFPLAAHEIAKSLGKEVSLEISGQSLELEKRILEKLKDPLMHILRNSIDHGIELPDERERNNKPRKGRVSVSVSQLDARKIAIEISDDGRGINIEEIRKAAIIKGIFPPKEAGEKTRSELYALLFESGFSTSRTITDLSGRGLGLAIAKNAMRDLDGTVEVDSEPGRSSSFKLVFPYMKAAFKGNLVRIGDRLFIIPSSSLEQGIRLSRQDIASAGNAKVIEYQGKTTSLVHLGSLLGIDQVQSNSAPDRMTAIVCKAQERLCAFIVDEILGEQDVFIKPLGELLRKVEGFYGATIGSNDEVILVLNMGEILDMAFSRNFNPAPTQTNGGSNATASIHKLATSSEGPIATMKNRILVIDDSITSRMLLSSILSSSGYQVKTATDGIEGFTMLKSEPFDLVVSDVEMPRLDGFGLTDRIRHEATIANIPIILVTALESKEHKERGIAAGANAYIIKSNFAQSNLIEAVKRFI